MVMRVKLTVDGRLTVNRPGSPPTFQISVGLFVSAAYCMCGYSQEGDIDIIYLLGFLIRAVFSHSV